MKGNKKIKPLRIKFIFLSSFGNNKEKYKKVADTKPALIKTIFPQKSIQGVSRYRKAIKVPRVHPAENHERMLKMRLTFLF
jgi:hypothetical protein